jgi:sigma-B regulation protein RsbU (phosphoserine phosphatase)
MMKCSPPFALRKRERKSKPQDTMHSSAAEKTESPDSRTQRLQQLIKDLSVEFISILDLDELIERVAQRLREVIDYKFFNILLVDEAREGLAWKKAVGYKPEEVERHPVIPFDRSIASAAYRAGHSIIVNDVTLDARYFWVETEGENDPRSEIAVPLIVPRENKIVGVLTIESLEPNFFTREHEHILNVLGAQLAIALEHARVYDELRQRTREMRTLVEIGHEITAILDLDKLLQAVAPLLERVINFEFLLVGLVDEARGEFVWHVEEGYSNRKRERSRTKLTQGVVGRAVRERRTQIVGDVTRDDDYFLTDTWRDNGQRSELAVPLMTEDKVIGVIALEHSCANAFNEAQARILENLANPLAIALANARLYLQHVEREKRLEKEILMARDVQRAMMPDAPKLKDFDFAARLEPALNLSGDFYDYIPLSPTRLGLMIGDVSGKGVRAAMGMAAARSLLRSAARRGGGPPRVMRDANTRLFRDLNGNLLLTLVYGVIDAETKSFQYCNAGHNPPLLVRASGKYKPLKAGGLLLGVFDKQPYKTETVQLEKGDVLFFYTDGLVEARTPGPELREFGEERLVEILLAHRHLKAAAILEAVLKDLRAFAERERQQDDLTLVVVKVA